jgi:hypothetical protein
VTKLNKKEKMGQNAEIEKKLGNCEEIGEF